jgi:hypothetical protein
MDKVKKPTESERNNMSRPPVYPAQVFYQQFHGPDT